MNIRQELYDIKISGDSNDLIYRLCEVVEIQQTQIDRLLEAGRLQILANAKLERMIQSLITAVGIVANDLKEMKPNERTGSSGEF